MSSKKISQLNSATTVQDTDIIPVVSGGVTKKTTKADLLKEVKQDVADSQADIEALQGSIVTKAEQADLSSHTGNTSNPHGVTKAQVGLENADNTSDANKPISSATSTALGNKADLVDGKVPSTQLPSYVDDVIEVANYSALPVTGETGKIYVTLDTNLTYRWSGSAYAEISASLALGETSGSAYRGDHGKTAYDHSLASGNPHGTTKSDVGLGNVDNTNDMGKPLSTAQKAFVDRIGADGSFATGNYTNKYEYNTDQGQSHNTSTFSGWGGYMGTPQNFDTVIFKVINRDSTAITKLRVIITTFNKAGTVLADKLITVNYAPGSNTLVTFDLGTVVANSAGAKLFFAFQTDKLVTIEYTNLPAGQVGNDTTYPFEVYTTTENQIFTGSISGWSNVSTPSQEVPWVQTYIKEVITLPIATADFIRGSLLVTRDTKWLKSFYEKVSSTSSLIMEYKTFAGYVYTTSVFSGWGGCIGNAKGFNAIKFKLKARATPITQAHVYLKEHDKNGVALADKLLSVNVPANTEVEITWAIGSVIPNTAGTQLYFAYVCDQVLDLGFATLDQVADGTKYGTTAYSTSGNMTTTPSQMVDVTGNTTNTIWAQFRLIDTFWAPTDEFKNEIGGGGTANSVSYNPASSGLVATNVQTAIDEVNTKISTADGVVWPNIQGPIEINAVVGDKLQIFVRGLIEAMNPYKHPYELNCSIGASYPRYFEVTPASGDVGTKALTVTVMDESANVKKTKVINLIVKNPTGQPSSNKNVLCVGDSLSAGGTWQQEFYRRVAQSGGSPVGLGYGNVKFIGQSPMSSYPTQKFTGYGGWTWASYTGASSILAYWVTATHDKDVTDQKAFYLDSNGNSWFIETIEAGRIKFLANAHSVPMPPANSTLTWSSGGSHHSTINYTAIAQENSTPFWDNTNHNFSFSAWMAQNSIAGNIDICYVLLGWNGLQIGTYDPNAIVLTEARVFLSKLLADYPSAQIRVMGIQVPSINGGMGANYGANGSYSAFYKVLRTVNALNRAYENMCGEPQYMNNCRFIGVAQQFDSENNMPASAVAVNSRNATTELRGTNGVHPGTEGYYQIADSAYRDFIRSFCS